PAIGVPHLADDRLVAALALAHQGHEIGLGTRGREQRRLESEQVGRLLLQTVHRGIVAEHVVTDLGPEHRLPHRCGRPGDGVAPESAHTGSAFMIRDLSLRLIRSAIRSAACRLRGSALPWPAMSKAVPWSGLVRTNGRPTVMLTPCSS